MNFLRDRSYLATVLAHLGVDLLNSQKSLLLAFLSTPLGLTNSLIGLVSSLYSLSASVSQPLFGLLADRFGTRWVAAGGVLWLSGLFGAAMLAPGYLALVLLVLAALGSAAFHPAGAMEAALRGRESFAGREATAASVFFFFGQGGLSFGPALGGPILDRWGPPGLLLLLVLVLPIGANAGLRITPGPPVQIQKGERRGSGRFGLPKKILIAFILLAALRGWAQFNFITFLPKYYKDLGYEPTLYGVIAALFMGASALANVAGGWLGDRFDRQKIVTFTLGSAALPVAIYPLLAATPLTYVLTPLAGALIGASQSIIVVTAQNLMPRRMGAASGLVLGFTFASGSLGTLLSGWQADHFGFGAFFVTTAGLILVAALLGFSIQTAPRFEKVAEAA